MQALRQIINRLNGKDPYTVLNTSPNDQFSTLKKNYRTLALKYHPDRNKQQSSKQMFIQINLAYQFLQQQSNRHIYSLHLKAIQQQKQRQNSLSQDRKRMLTQLKRRQQQYIQRKKDIDEQIKRKKQFFDKKMKQEQQRQKIRQQILSQIKPNQYYQQLTSIKVQWMKGLSFTKNMIERAFSQYGKVISVKIQTKKRQAIVMFSSIEICSNVIKQFDQLMIKIDYLVTKQRRQHLLKAMKKDKYQKGQIDFSLTTENLARLKQVINRNSGTYLDPNSMRYQDNY